MPNDLSHGYDCIYSDSNFKTCLSFISVFSASTSNCSHLIPFDGSGNGVLNMKEFLVGHDVLRDYLFNFLHGR